MKNKTTALILSGIIASAGVIAVIAVASFQSTLAQTPMTTYGGGSSAAQTAANSSAMASPTGQSNGTTSLSSLSNSRLCESSNQTGSASTGGVDSYWTGQNNNTTVNSMAVSPSTSGLFQANQTTGSSAIAGNGSSTSADTSKNDLMQQAKSDIEHACASLQTNDISGALKYLQMADGTLGQALNSTTSTAAIDSGAGNSTGGIISGAGYSTKGLSLDVNPSNWNLYKSSDQITVTSANSTVIQYPCDTGTNAASAAGENSTGIMYPCAGNSGMREVPPYSP